jgi:hypothetical protein
MYCLESHDLPAGTRLADVAVILPAAAAEAPVPRPLQVADQTVQTLSAKGLRMRRQAWPETSLYRPVEAAASEPIDLTLIPYFAWGNRGEGEMTVWLPAQHHTP